MFNNNYDYRADYFRNHKGLFGTGIYFCSYCGRPVTRKNSHVDHIIPKSKSNYAFNRSYNTTISCPKCNLKKSDKMDYRIVQGYASKLGGSVFGGVFGLAGNLMATTVSLGTSLLKALMQGVVSIVSWGIRLSLGLISSIISGIFSVILGNIVVIFIAGAVILLLLTS